MIPLRSNILIEPFEVRSDIFVVSDKLTIEKARVIATGNDVTSILPNDVIVYKNYSPDVIEIDGKEFVFIKEEDVIALS